LECVCPLQQLVSFYRRILQAPTLNPVEKDIDGGKKMMQLNSSSKLSRSEPQGVSLGPRPGSPLNYDSATETQDLLCDIPLKFLDSQPSFAVPEVDPDGVHPLVSAKANATQVMLNLLGVRCLAGTG